MASTLSLDFRNTNTLWCSVLVETLVRCGVTQAVTSPGSRSTPLTMALAGNAQIDAVPVLDERSAAFFALGLAKSSRRPVALVCTSGTAAANYYPAIIEAFESGVPLVVLTADRPPEARACSSGQTIDQQKLYGSHVVFYHELAVPEANLSRLRYLRQTVRHAVKASAGPSAGPVHLNCPFRDPLVPQEDGLAANLSGQIDDEFFRQTHPVPLALPTLEIDITDWPKRGIIVAGPDAVRDARAYANSVGLLARALGWPVLADALSPARRDLGPDVTVVSAYDTILRDENLAKQLRPEAVLCLGGWPTSKVLRTWIDRSAASIWLVSPSSINRDGLHGLTDQWHGAVEAIKVNGHIEAETAFARQWAEHEQRLRQDIEGQLEQATLAFEPKIVHLLAHHLPDGSALHVANSMPVRDLEYFWPIQKAGREIEIFFNRGANGIDGTTSTAAGIGYNRKHAVLLTGDLSFFHDVNGLLLSQTARNSLTIILINNEGGGIFEHLPVANYERTFERYFATPQRVDVAKLAEAYGCKHLMIETEGELIRALSCPEVRQWSILELRTNRKINAQKRKQLFQKSVG